MNRDRLRAVLEGIAAGTLSAADGLQRLEGLPYEDLGFARVDHHRHLRQGAPEVIFGTGKSPEQIVEIAARIVEHGSNVLVTRADYPTFELLRMRMGDAVFHETARAVTVPRHAVEQ